MEKAKTFEIIPKGMRQRSNAESGITGESDIAVNLRERENCMEVVGDAEVIGRMSDNERLVYIDHRPDGDYYLIVHDSSSLWLHGVMKKGRYELRGEFIGDECPMIWSARSTGDFTVFYTDEGVKYLLFNGGHYRPINPQDAVPTLLIDDVDQSSVNIEIPSFTLTGGYRQWMRPLTAADSATLQNAVRDSYANRLSTEGQDGRMVQPVAVRYGVRLWDDNYLWLSAPVVVGVGIQAAALARAEVSADFTTVGSSVMAVKSYSIGITALKGTAAGWDSHIKSIDLLVTDAIDPFITPRTVDYRCDTTQTGTKKYYLSYQLMQKNVAVVDASLVNPDKWKLMCCITDLAALRQGIIAAPNVRTATFTHGGALAAKLYSVSNTNLYSDTLSRDDVNRIVGQIRSTDAPAVSASCDGRIYSAAGSRRIAMPWHSTNFWRSCVTDMPCSVKMTALLKTTGGIATVTSDEQWDYTPQELSALLAFPDPRATELSVTVTSALGVTRWHSGLSSASSGGMAFALSKDYISNALSPGNTDERTDCLTDADSPSLLRVSAKDNPFVVDETRLVGAGTITGLAAACRPIYSSVFGRYPLYAFTSEGIYAIAYKVSGDYRDVQLIDRRCRSSGSDIATAAGDIYFVSDSADLCRIAGKTVDVMIRGTDAVSLAWNRTENELWMASAVGAVSVLMPSGRTCDRSEELNQLYGDFFAAVAIGADGMMRNILCETAAKRKVSLSAFAAAPSRKSRMTPIGVSWNLLLRDADVSVELLGQGENGCDLMPLLRKTVTGSHLGECGNRLFAPRQRLVKLTASGVALAGSQFRECELYYLE